MKAPLARLAFAIAILALGSYAVFAWRGPGGFRALSEKEARIKELEKQVADRDEQILALQAKQVATPVIPEPAQAAEPQQQQGIEPGNHSELLHNLKESLLWNSPSN